MRGLPEWLGRAIRGHRFALAAFLIPLGIRAVPEIIAGPYPIGYDTITAYVPLMYDWASGDTARQFNPLGGGWLVFAVFGVLHSSTGIDPILIAKVAAPSFYGVLGLSEYFFARRLLSWDEKKSLFLVVIASFYFVSLRLSWDLLRNTLGLAFLLLALTIGRELKSPKDAAVFSGLVLLVTFTHLLMATILLGVSLLQAFFLEGRNWRRLVSLVPGAALFITSLFGLQAEGISTFGTNTGGTQSFWILGYSFYIFLPLLPLVLVEVQRLRLPVANYWLVVCLAGILFELIPVGLSSWLVWPERWAISMTFPLAIFATEGFSRLRTANVRWSFKPARLAYLWLGLILILSVAYVGLPASSAFPYYRFFVPTSMLQSTVPLEGSPDVAGTFEWLSSNIRPGSLIVVHNAMYGWARVYIAEKAPILCAESGVTLEEALETALQTVYSRIYTVWWANGEGWYNEPTVPYGFVLQHQQGDFGVFLYSR